MPTSKSSTSSRMFQRAVFEKKAAEGDHLFLLKELLAVIHRDGGQYTELAGLALSVEDAIESISNARAQIVEFGRLLRAKHE